MSPVKVSLGVEGKWTWGENNGTLELHAAKGSGFEEEDSGNGGLDRSGSGRALRIGRGLGIRTSADEVVSPRRCYLAALKHEDLRHEALLSVVRTSPYRC